MWENNDEKSEINEKIKIAYTHEFFLMKYEKIGMWCFV